jgi:hypothetical protein
MHKISGLNHVRRVKDMNPVSKEGFELDIQIEELESKVAPDGGETVLPLELPKKH